MANGITTAFWSITINNYDDRDLAIIRNGYPDFCREIVHTLEEGGETGTPHIQAWVKLQRQQRMAFVRKLFPGGHYKPLTSDEYNQHTKVYCQKLDSTAVSPAIHKFQDPVHTLETVCRRVGQKLAEAQINAYEKRDNSSWDTLKTEIERDMVSQEDFRFAKVFVSATYKHMWKEFGVEMCIFFATHTHTHTHPDENVSRVDIPTNGEDGDEGEEGEGASQSEDGECGEDYEDGSDSEDEGYDSGGSSSDCSEDARSED